MQLAHSSEMACFVTRRSPRKLAFAKGWKATSITEHEELIRRIESGDRRAAADDIRDVHWSYDVQERFIEQYYSSKTVVGARQRGPLMLTGVIFNIQRFSIHDGPGIRTTVFVKGCPLHCPWCHNPESRDPGPTLSFLPERCIECEACLETCPNDVAIPLALDPSGRRNGHRCTLCARCAEVCPSGARATVGKPYTVDHLLKEIDKDWIFYDESGGGVTFSGGEPLAPKRNADFLLACLEACRDRGYHRAVDTSGFAPRETILAAARLTDLFLYDLKLWDDARHRQHVGVSNRPALENLEALSRLGSHVWIRIPLIPGINDDEPNLEDIAAFVASLDRPYPVHLLPYHKVGGDKYRRLGRDYPLSHLEPPAKQHAEAAADRFRSFGLKVRIGG